MARDVAQLFEEASQLSETDRAELAGRLLQSLEGEPDEGVEAACRGKLYARLHDQR